MNERLAERRTTEMDGGKISGLAGLFLLYDGFYGIGKAWRDGAAICKWMKEERGRRVRHQARGQTGV